MHADAPHATVLTGAWTQVPAGVQVSTVHGLPSEQAAGSQGGTSGTSAGASEASACDEAASAPWPAAGTDDVGVEHAVATTTARKRARQIGFIPVIASAPARSAARSQGLVTFAIAVSPSRASLSGARSPPIREEGDKYLKTSMVVMIKDVACCANFAGIVQVLQTLIGVPGG